MDAKSSQFYEHVVVDGYSMDKWVEHNERGLIGKERGIEAKFVHLDGEDGP